MEAKDDCTVMNEADKVAASLEELAAHEPIGTLLLRRALAADEAVSHLHEYAGGSVYLERLHARTMVVYLRDRFRLNPLFESSDQVLEVANVIHSSHPRSFEKCQDLFQRFMLELLTQYVLMDAMERLQNRGTWQVDLEPLEELVQEDPSYASGLARVRLHELEAIFAKKHSPLSQKSSSKAKKSSASANKYLGLDQRQLATSLFPEDRLLPMATEYVEALLEWLGKPPLTAALEALAMLERHNAANPHGYEAASPSRLDSEALSETTARPQKTQTGNENLSRSPGKRAEIRPAPVAVAVGEQAAQTTALATKKSASRSQTSTPPASAAVPPAPHGTKHAESALDEAFAQHGRTGSSTRVQEASSTVDQQQTEHVKSRTRVPTPAADQDREPAAKQVDPTDDAIAEALRYNAPDEKRQRGTAAPRLPAAKGARLFRHPSSLTTNEYVATQEKVSEHKRRKRVHEPVAPAFESDAGGRQPARPTSQPQAPMTRPGSPQPTKPATRGGHELPLSNEGGIKLGPLVRYTPEEDEALLDGIRACGVGHWRLILNRIQDRLQEPHRSYQSVRKRAEQLISQIGTLPEPPPPLNSFAKVHFTAEEDAELRKGIDLFGYGSWSRILKHGRFHPKRTAESLKSRARVLKLNRLL